MQATTWNCPERATGPGLRPGLTFSERLRLSMRAVSAFLIAAVQWLTVVVVVPLLALYVFSALTGG